MKKRDKRDALILKQLGKRIAIIRKEKKITQLELAFRCDIEGPNITRIESGGTNPTFLTLKKIAEGLEISIDELLKF